MKEKHQQEKRDCNIAAKLKIQLLMEEEEQDYENFLRADSCLQKLPEITKKSVWRAYKNLFQTDLLDDMIEACTCGDETTKAYRKPDVKINKYNYLFTR